MKILVVYDSVFGNTEKVAQAIGDALGAQVLRVGDVKPEQLTGLDALIVGSPTQAFQPLKGIKVAAFDTRADVQEVNSRILTLFVKLFGCTFYLPHRANPVKVALARLVGAGIARFVV